jgi:hypothetical protein
MCWAVAVHISRLLRVWTVSPPELKGRCFSDQNLCSSGPGARRQSRLASRDDAEHCGDQAAHTCKETGWHNYVLIAEEIPGKQHRPQHRQAGQQLVFVAIFGAKKNHSRFVRDSYDRPY